MIKPPSRWIPRTLVALTVLICLGAGGYAGQVWSSKKIAAEVCTFQLEQSFAKKTCSNCQSGSWESEFFSWTLLSWRSMPWYGWAPWRKEEDHGDAIDPMFVMLLGTHHLWVFPRTHYEFAKLTTGLDFGNDPSAWEDWLKAHPNLNWDSKLHRLVDAPPPPR